MAHTAVRASRSRGGERGKGAADAIVTSEKITSVYISVGEQCALTTGKDERGKDFELHWG